MNRPEVSLITVDDVFEEVKQKLLARLVQKGYGTFASSHEVLGILEEELYEFKKAVHEKEGREAKIEELKDIAVAAIFGIACYKEGNMHW